MNRLKRRGTGSGAAHLTLLLLWSFALIFLLFIGLISTMALPLRDINKKREHCSSKSEDGRQPIAPLSAKNDEGARDRLQRFV